jgi:uncharacterized protein
MASGLIGLFDDVAALAKLAASSVDDVGAAAAKASAKAAGIVVDDTAVTPGYVRGLASEREIPIIAKIARGSLRNKILFILPVAMILSLLLPVAVEIVLLCGGVYLTYEGAHKVLHLRHAKHDHTEEVLAVSEKEVIAGAIRTDLVLSAEIMVIALKDVLDQGVVARAAILVIVAVFVTVAVYGLVALLVKADDFGLRLAESSRPKVQSFGLGVVRAMPKVMDTLTFVGMAAMLWVGGHILIVGAAELGWHGPEGVSHWVHGVAGGVPIVGGVLGWVAETLLSAAVGLVVGCLVAGGVSVMKRFKSKKAVDALG